MGWFVAGFVVGITLAVAVDSMETKLVLAQHVSEEGNGDGEKGAF